jgi:hypothetical protein
MADEKPKGPPWGRFYTLSRTQLLRIYGHGLLVRSDPGRYRALMSPDPDGYKDDHGEAYWGSCRHIVETALMLLDREVEKLAGRKKK